MVPPSQAEQMVGRAAREGHPLRLPRLRGRAARLPQGGEHRARASRPSSTSTAASSASSRPTTSSPWTFRACSSPRSVSRYPSWGYRRKQREICMNRRLLVALVAAVVSLTATASTQASFPGPNGKIAFESTASDNGIGLINPDGSGLRLAGEQLGGAADRPGVLAGRPRRGLRPGAQPLGGARGRQLAAEAADERRPERPVPGLLARRHQAGVPAQRLGGGHLGDRPRRQGPDQSHARTRRAASSPRSGRPTAPASRSRAAAARPDDDSGTCIWVMNADGSGKVNVTPEDVRAECPSFAAGNSHRRHSLEPTWSPDSKMIAFTGHYDICVNDPAVNSSDIWVMNADGSGKRDLTSADKTVDRQPSWSPDGGEHRLRARARRPFRRRAVPHPGGRRRGEPDHEQPGHRRGPRLGTHGQGRARPLRQPHHWARRRPRR